jgi:hypothetical protein
MVTAPNPVGFRKTSPSLQSTFAANWRSVVKFTNTGITAGKWKFVAAGNQCVPSH